MAYRLTGTDPFFRCSIGAFNGYGLWQNPFSFAALLKRRSVSTWQGIYLIDDGGTTNKAYPYEFNPSNQLAGDMTAANPFDSNPQAFNDTTNWLILGATWNGGSSSGDWVWRWKVGSGAWGNQNETNSGFNANTVGSGYRHLVGNEAGLGDDADYDITCIGAIQSDLSQASFESLDMSSFSTWQNVFTGSGAWLIGFETLATQSDRTGNGGDESSRSAGITLQADPAGWVWGAAAPALPPRVFNAIPFIGTNSRRSPI